MSATSSGSGIADSAVNQVMVSAYDVMHVGRRVLWFVRTSERHGRIWKVVVFDVPLSTDAEARRCQR